MKTKLNLFIYLMATALTLVSCKKDTLDPLNGIYTPPEIMDFTILDSQTRDKDNSLFIFTVNLKDDASNTLNLKFVSTEFSLPTSDYTPSVTAANRTYLIGSGGSTCNGQQISSSTITVSVVGSNYTMEGILHLADETVVRMTGAFSIVYEYIPLYTYRIETETPATNNGTPIAGTTKHKITVNSDAVLYAYFEVITDESATSLSGTYAVKDGIDAAGQVNNGYYIDWSWYGGAGVMEGGSYYIKNGDKMYLREAGSITIVEAGSTLTITGENLGILDLATLISSNGMTWQNIAVPGSVNIENATEELTTVFSASATDLSGYGLNYYSTVIKIATGGVMPTYNAATYSWDYSGSGNVISLEFKRDDATLPAGNYSVVSSDASAIGDCVAGYPNPFGGTDLWGTTWGTVTDGVLSNVAINSGNVGITVNGDTYTVIVDVTTDDGSVKTIYSGPITFAK